MNVSVCLATYNGARFLAQQLASIVPQLRDGDEIALADDGSTDETVEVARTFGPLVRVVGTERVGGVVPNFERALAGASGDVIMLCDQDDVWLPGRVDLVRARLRHVDLVQLNGEVVDEDLAPRSVSVFEHVRARPGFLRNLARNSFVGCCMAFRRTLRDRVLPFPEGVPWHDWYIGLVASGIARVEFVDQRTMLYRRHGANASATGEVSQNSLWRMAAMRLAVVRAVGIAVFRGSKTGQG